MNKLFNTAKNKKGFTLMEIIVVMVILAIMVAVALPSMIGFVNDARGKAFAAEARVGMVAAQAVVTEIVASGGELDKNSGDAKVTPKDGTATLITDYATFENMTEDDIDGAFSKIVVDTDLNRVTGLTFISGDGYPGDYEVVISGSTTTVTKITD